MDIAQIHTGARCLFCLKVIEVDLFYPMLVAVASVLSVSFLFANSYGLMGLILTVLIVLFNSAYRQITSRFFPLKTYEK